MIEGKIFKRESTRSIQNKLTLENNKKNNYRFSLDLKNQRY